ncbi:MAG: CoA transferase [Chloroflexi bacterium]|nr:CoA transferase [Chloroflexota bacterium]
MASKNRSQPATLDDIRVLDLAGEAGAYCGKLLADLGADVIKIEPPDGDPARRSGPFFHDDPDPNKSLYFFAHNTGKRSITLDIASESGRAALKRLVEKADVIVEAYPPGYLDGLGLGYRELGRSNPRLVYCSITGFGLSGPHAGYKDGDLIAVAMSGMMYLAGEPDDPPNRPYGNQAYYCGSIEACSGILTALLHRDHSGEGQMVEVSLQEALARNQETAMQYWDIRKELRKRIGAAHRLPGIGHYQCRDGYATLMVGVPGFGAPLPVLIQWMDEEGMAGDLMSEEWKQIFGQIDLRLIGRLYQGQADPEEIATWKPRLEHVDGIIGKFVATRTKMEMYENGQTRGLLVAPVSTPKDVVENPQLNFRNWFTEVEHPELGGTIRYPGPPYHFIDTPWRITRRPPLLGEHTREVFEEFRLAEALAAADPPEEKA